MSVKFIVTSCLGGPRPPCPRIGLAVLTLALTAAVLTLALTAAVIALAVVLCASSAASEIDRALRVSWWFS